MGGAVESFEGREAQQRDSGKLEAWAITNCMKLNKSKFLRFFTWDGAEQALCTNWRKRGWSRGNRMI